MNKFVLRFLAFSFVKMGERKIKSLKHKFSKEQRWSVAKTEVQLFVRGGIYIHL